MARMEAPIHHVLEILVALGASNRAWMLCCKVSFPPTRDAWTFKLSRAEQTCGYPFPVRPPVATFVRYEPPRSRESPVAKLVNVVLAGMLLRMVDYPMLEGG